PLRPRGRRGDRGQQEADRRPDAGVEVALRRRLDGQDQGQAGHQARPLADGRTISEADRVGGALIRTGGAAVNLIVPRPEAKKAERQRFVLYGVDWATYEKLIDAFGEFHVRMTYDRGTLELM